MEGRVLKRCHVEMGSAPEHIKEIVYTMRFDEASARYAEFGPFYIGYVLSPKDAIGHLNL